jgi:hypothetical protein
MGNLQKKYIALQKYTYISLILFSFIRDALGLCKTYLENYFVQVLIPPI